MNKKTTIVAGAEALVIVKNERGETICIDTIDEDTWRAFTHAPHYLLEIEIRLTTGDIDKYLDDSFDAPAACSGYSDELHALVADPSEWDELMRGGA